MAHNCDLIIFVKHPKPGFAKTRLIPVLGPEGAASLSKELTEHCIAQACLLSASWDIPNSDLRIRIFYTSKDTLPSTFYEAWIRPLCPADQPLHFHEQVASPDLGERMENAFKTCFELGSHHAIIVGTDIPKLSAKIMRQAFDILTHHSTNHLVIGPAYDGGYYLLGMSALYSSLFHNIVWSTDQVFPSTLEKAKQADLQTLLVETLSDVDTEREWRVYQASKTQSSQSENAM